MPIKTLFDSNFRNPYYIVAPAYTRLSAGIRVLHLLADILCKRGYQVFLASPELNPAFSAPPLTEEIVDFHNSSKANPIVIYPEIVEGNPFQASCVIRYILNHPGKLGGPVTFPAEDLLVWYTDGMRKQYNSSGLTLSLPYIDTTVYYPTDTQYKRKGKCFYAHKYLHIHKGKLHNITDDAVQITAGEETSQTPHQIANLFRQSEMFYCYESSGLSFEALLCGCPVTLIPSEHYKKEEVILPEELHWKGVSWGTDEAAQEAARSSVHEVPILFGKWIEAFNQQVDQFILRSQQLALDRPKSMINLGLIFGLQTPPRLIAERLHMENNTLTNLISTLKQESDTLTQQSATLKLDMATLVSNFKKEIRRINEKNSFVKSKIKASKEQIRRIRADVERWNNSSWFRRAFHKLRLRNYDK